MRLKSKNMLLNLGECQNITKMSIETVIQLSGALFITNHLDGDTNVVIHLIKTQTAKVKEDSKNSMPRNTKRSMATNPW